MAQPLEIQRHREPDLAIARELGSSLWRATGPGHNGIAPHNTATGRRPATVPGV